MVTVIASLAVSALLIAAVNVTNILFSRAARRTRSVGILKALGAGARSIFALFTIEALIIAACGALLGGVLGVIMLELFQRSLGFEGIPMVALVTGVLFSTGLVALFTIAPAAQASRLDPAKAIRNE